ncbi:MAG: F0F1 ATP synthase subunit B [Oscillospiraceae bacterium]|nr:F0F1 ATP synthase subunit B [Oscillospiraceae bacterium]
MQNLEIISINFWQIFVSLLNLVLLFLILKKLLYKPVRKAIQEREDALNQQYQAASDAEARAKAHEAEWNETLQNANAKADEIIKAAQTNASRRSEEIVNDAKGQAKGILTQARNEIELERKKSEDGIKHEIVDISALMAEKLLGREINQEDHRAWIDSFMQEIGESDDRNQ